MLMAADFALGLPAALQGTDAIATQPTIAPTDTALLEAANEPEITDAIAAQPETGETTPEMPDLSGLKSRELRDLAKREKMPKYSTILRDRGTEGLREELAMYLAG